MNYELLCNTSSPVYKGPKPGPLCILQQYVQICKSAYARTRTHKITPYHLHLFTYAQRQHSPSLMYFHCLRGYIWNEMPPVNLCNSADSHAKPPPQQNLFGCHSFVWSCFVTHTRASQVQLVLEWRRAVISARKWFKAMKLAVAGGRMGLISHSTSDS